MSSPEIKIWFYARPDKSLTIEERHSQVMARMSKVGSPLGFKDIEIPAAPSCDDGLVASYKTKLSVKGVLCFGDYKYRGGNYLYEDLASYDEHCGSDFEFQTRKLITSMF